MLCFQTWDVFFQGLSNISSSSTSQTEKGDLLVAMDTKEIHDHLRVQGLIKAYQVIFIKYLYIHYRDIFTKLPCNVTSL